MKTFGDFKDCSEHLAHAVYGFFNNGGSRCFVVNVGAPQSLEIEQVAAPVTAPVVVKEGEKKPDAPKEAPKAKGPGNTDGLYIGLGALTDAAMPFAREHGIAVWNADDLARALRGLPLGDPAKR